MSKIERYDYAFDPDGEEWAARLLRRVPASAATVLELGPGPGAMTRVLRERGHRITVVENDPQALKVLTTLGVEIVSGNLEGSDWRDALAGRRFDVVLACDVLEHLRRPEDVLQHLGEFMAPMGQLVISVPNIAYAGVLASMRGGIFDYADKGQLDRTHVRFFTKRSMEKMLLDSGWAPRSWEANRVPIDHSEFVHLSAERIDDVVAIMRGEGMNATVSSIHVNGWFGQYDKLSMAHLLMRERYGLELSREREKCMFVGDSPNDAPMFAYLPHAAGVANVAAFAGRMRHLPTYVAPSRGGAGFAEVAQALLAARQR